MTDDARHRHDQYAPQENLRTHFLPSLKDFGAVGNGVTDDTAAIAKAEASPWPRIYVPSGTYPTTASYIFKRYGGPGKIKVSATTYPHESSIIDSAPASAGSESFSSVFSGDFSKTMSAETVRIVGAGTLGTPSTGYKYTPEASAHYLHFINDSGWNQSSSGNDGRTSATAYRTVISHNGKGDAVAYNAVVSVNGTPSGTTHWLANGAGVILNGDVGVSKDHLYCNPIEINLYDNNHDAAGVGAVYNLWRNTGTASQGEIWMGVRVQSNGSTHSDVAYSLTGKFKRGLDTCNATLDSDNAAVTLQTGHRIYFNSSDDLLNGVRWYSTTLGGEWIAHSSGNGIEVAVNSARAALFSAPASGANYVKITGSVSGAPVVDSNGGGLQLAANGTNHVLLDGSGVKLQATNLGFFGASPSAKPTVSGSRGGNAALGSLLTALAGLGLLTDGSS